MSVKVKINNRQLQTQVQKELRKTDSDLHKTFVKSLRRFNVAFVGFAKQNARGMALRQGIVSHDENLKNLEGGLAATREYFYAPYVEFGTRGKTKIPPGFEQIAKQYKGSYFKSNVSFKEAIVDWLKKKVKKSDKEANQLAWPVMRKIMKVGTDPKPFIAPALKRAEKFLIKELNLNIKKILK